MSDSDGAFARLLVEFGQQVATECRELRRAVLAELPTYVAGVNTAVIDPGLIAVESSYLLTKDEGSSELDIMFSLRREVTGPLAGRDVARFDIVQRQGDLGNLGPTILPVDRESAAYGLALRSFADEACRLCREAVPSVISVLREELGDYSTRDAHDK